MHFMSQQQLVKSVRESLIVDIGKDVVHAPVLKQVVLYAYSTHTRIVNTDSTLSFCVNGLLWQSYARLS